MSENLPSIDDFTEDNSKLPSADDIIKEENLPSVEGGDALRIPVNVISASKFEAYSEKISTNGVQ